MQSDNLSSAAAVLRVVLPYCLETENRRGMAHGLTLTASLLLTRKRYPEAALVMGILETLRDRAQLPLAADRAEEYRVEREHVRKALGEAIFTERHQQGCTLSDREALEYLLRELS
jgi:hypothetical protein